MTDPLPTRWEIELEFVQSLSNIQYVNYLAQNSYFSNEEFINYLNYLTYWKEPNNSKYLVYPNCLHILTLLQSEEFRKSIVNPEFMNSLMNDMVKRWQNPDDGIFSGITPKSPINQKDQIQDQNQQPQSQSQSQSQQEIPNDFESNIPSSIPQLNDSLGISPSKETINSTPNIQIDGIDSNSDRKSINGDNNDSIVLSTQNTETPNEGDEKTNDYKTNESNGKIIEENGNDVEQKI